MRRKLAPLRSLNGCSEVFAVKNRRRMESILRRNNYGEDEELCGSRNKKKRKSKRKMTPQSRSSKKAKAKRAMNLTPKKIVHSEEATPTIPDMRLRPSICVATLRFFSEPMDHDPIEVNVNFMQDADKEIVLHHLLKSAEMDGNLNKTLGFSDSAERPILEHQSRFLQDRDDSLKNILLITGSSGFSASVIQSGAVLEQMIGEALQSHQLKWFVLFKFWLGFLHVIISFLNFMALLVLHVFGYSLKRMGSKNNFIGKCCSLQESTPAKCLATKVIELIPLSDNDSKDYIKAIVAVLFSLILLDRLQVFFIRPPSTEILGHFYIRFVLLKESATNHS
ncbi:hypothetical protein SDJN03_14242, partial [Cucurbita argyrosperma subsp. sororia]